MSISNASDLLTSLGRYMIYDDMSADFDNLLGLAEAVLNREIRVRQMQSSQAYASQSTQTLTLPSDFLEVITFYQEGDSGGALEYVPPKLFWNSKDARTGSGQPAFYTVSDSTLTLSPSPDGARDYRLEYYASVPSLDLATQTTNDLLTAAPDVYLWQLLYQASLLADDQASQAKYQQNYEQAKASLLAADNRARNRPGPRMRSRSTRDGAYRFA